MGVITLESRVASRITTWTLGFVALLYGAWIVAWIAEEALARHIAWISSDGGQFAYWTTMKLALWVVPAVVWIHLSGRRVGDVMAADRWRSALLWGGGIGLALAALSIVPKAFGHHPFLASRSTWVFLDAVVVAPIVEEFTFRGAVLGGL